MIRAVSPSVSWPPYSLTALKATTMTEYTSDKFKSLLEKLVKTPEYFTPDDLKLALEHLFTPDVVSPTQIGAFLAAMHIQRVERRPENLAAAAEVLRSRALKAVVEDDDKDFVVDIVGTGGDGHNTFNVSTAAAIVAAGAGARVVKVSTFRFRPPPAKVINIILAWQSRVDLLVRLRRSPTIARLSLRRSDGREADAHCPRSLYVHPRPALPPLRRTHRTLPQSPPLPHSLQRHRPAHQPRTSPRYGPRRRRTRARAPVCEIAAGRRRGERVGRLWRRRPRRDQLCGGYVGVDAHAQG